METTSKNPVSLPKPIGTNRLFKVGESAVYPAHGVAIIKRIEERMVAGKKKSFYVLQVVENQMTIMVPTDNAGAVGLREIISDRDVRKVYTILKKHDVKIDSTTWNRRYREYMEKIKTGSVFEIAEVLRNLFLLRHSKDLSFGERKMLDHAKHLLVREISLAKRLAEDVVEQEIQTIFSQ
jgi:CarD family transcriptional regulator